MYLELLSTGAQAEFQDGVCCFRTEAVKLCSPKADTMSLRIELWNTGSVQLSASLSQHALFYIVSGSDCKQLAILHRFNQAAVLMVVVFPCIKQACCGV
jgi:hypothetical protein